jgi:MFS family permease
MPSNEIWFLIHQRAWKLVYVFNFIDRNILAILAQDIKADLGLSDAQLGFLYGTAFAVFYAVFGIPLGRLADIWVRRKLIAVGLAFWSVMTALSGTARSFFTLGAYRIGVGIGESSASPAAFSMLCDYFPPRLRATVMSIYSSGIYIGAGIGVFLGGWVIDGSRRGRPHSLLSASRVCSWPCGCGRCASPFAVRARASSRRPLIQNRFGSSPESSRPLYRRSPSGA